MKLLTLTFLFFLHVLVSSGQAVSVLEKIKQDSAVDVYLTLDWKDLEKHKNDKVYRPASFVVPVSSGDSLKLIVKVKTRGHMRLEICSFPPIRLKFEKGELASHSLSPITEISLVHHCHEGDQYDQYLLREFMAYKLFELISPYCFHVQLIRLHYRNSTGEEAHESSYAFLLENTDELADRIHGKKIKTEIISRFAIEHETFLSVCLFQFMIGNTDWYIPLRHNLEFLGVPPHKLLVTIPYDFDYSGLVNAPYAEQHESLKLPSVQIRYYQGWCQTKEEVDNALKVFRDNKEKILGMCDHIQGFNEKSVKHTREYLQDFFNIIENPKKLQNLIMEHCNMWPVPN